MPKARETEVTSDTLRRRTRGRPSKIEQGLVQQDILRGAWSVFVEKGFEAATVQAICDRGDVGLATFYKHFPDKSAVFARCIGEKGAYLANYRFAGSANDSTEERLIAVGLDLVAKMHTDELGEAVRLIYTEGRRFPEIVGAFQAALMPWYKEIKLIIESAATSLDEVQVEDLSLMYIDMVAGFSRREIMLGLQLFGENRTTRAVILGSQIFAQGLRQR